MAHTVTFDSLVRLKPYEPQEEPEKVAKVPEVALDFGRWAEKQRAANNDDIPTNEDLCLIQKTVVNGLAMALMLVIAYAAAGTSGEAVRNILIIAGILGTFYMFRLMVEGGFRLWQWCYKQRPYTLPMPRPARMARWERQAQTGHRSDDLKEVIIEDTGAKTPMSEASFWA